MSTRLHRSIGWGMPWKDFCNRCLLVPGEDGMGEVLYETFSSMSDKSMIVDDVDNMLFYGANPEVKPPIIFDKRLLQCEDKVGDPTDLYKLVMTCDEVQHVIFYPNSYYAKKWLRVDDDVDYAFEKMRLRREQGNSFDIEDVVEYLNYGHYPWASFYMMAKTGQPVAWEPFFSPSDDDVPAVPTEIRWYLNRFGILSHDGINQLRPIIANWWI